MQVWQKNCISKNKRCCTTLTLVLCNSSFCKDIGHTPYLMTNYSKHSMRTQLVRLNKCGFIEVWSRELMSEHLCSSTNQLVKGAFWYLEQCTEIHINDSKWNKKYLKQVKRNIGNSWQYNIMVVVEFVMQSLTTEITQSFLNFKFLFYMMESQVLLWLTDYSFNEMNAINTIFTTTQLYLYACSKGNKWLWKKYPPQGWLLFYMKILTESFTTNIFKT